MGYEKMYKKMQNRRKKKIWRKQWKIKYSVYIYKHDTCMCYINEHYIYIYVLQASIYNVHAWRILYRNHFYELYA